MTLAVDFISKVWSVLLLFLTVWFLVSAPPNYLDPSSFLWIFLKGFPWTANQIEWIDYLSFFVFSLSDIWLARANLCPDFRPERKRQRLWRVCLFHLQ